MKNKLIKKLNYFVGQINSGDINTGLCRDVIDKVKDYIKITETELETREINTLIEIRHNNPLRMILAMSGVYVSLTVTNETIRFLYNNIEELRDKNSKYSLSLMLVKLQNLLDYTYFYAEMYRIYRQVFTIKELKELQKEINSKWIR